MRVVATASRSRCSALRVVLRFVVFPVLALWHGIDSEGFG